MEIICAMVYQLTKNLTIEQAKTAGFDAYYIDHTAALWPQAENIVSEIRALAYVDGKQ